MTNNVTNLPANIPANIVRGTDSNPLALPAPTETPMKSYEWKATYHTSEHPRPAARDITKDEARAITLLTEMLTFMRPEGSKSQRKFINKYLRPLGVGFDKKGNAYLHVPLANGDAPTVLWSSHTDTVHSKSGRQRVAMSNGFLKVHHSEATHCLGADCTTGVWLMIEMIRAKVPGFYIFHTGEEIGGLGSSYIARHEPELIRGFKAAIAFDRRGTRSIITHQAGGRCCSDAFAESLNKALDGNRFLDSGGTFTDTANYTDIIGECTNISVGYFNEHGRNERQCMLTALNLRKSLLAFDESKLTFKRKPGESDWGRSDLWGECDEDHWGYGLNRSSSSRRRNLYRSYYGGTSQTWERDASTGWDRRSTNSDFEELVDLIKSNPEGVADYLETYGTDPRALRDHILDSYGFVKGRK